VNREYLEDYEQREKAEWNKLLRRMQEGSFSFKKDRYPQDERFVNLQKPVAVLSTIGLANAKDIWAMVPFCGSLIRYLPPVRQEEFEKFYFKISEIPKIVEFIQETGKLQVVFTVSNFRAYEGLDFLDPFFQLKPPTLVGISMDVFGDKKAIQKAATTFYTISKIKYVDWLKDRYNSLGLSSQVFLSALRRKLDVYTILKLGHYEIIENIENLMVDDPEEAHWLLTISGIFVTDQLVDLRSDLRNFSLEGIKHSSKLPLVYQPKLQLPCEIGKFLVTKLTYAPLGLDACKELMYHYDAYDLRKVQEALNEGIVTNHPEIIDKSAEELSEILDNVWNDKTMPHRVKGLQIGIPLSMAAIGSVAAGPIGAAGGFLAGLGYSVTDKFIDLRTEGLSERLAKLKTKSYQANIYDFKEKYKHNIPKPSKEGQTNA